MRFQDVDYPDAKLPCNRGNMTKLVTALESGEYWQGKSYLLTVDNGTRKFCCLGVACEISGLGSWEHRDDTPEGENVYVTKGDESATRLPDPVAAWLGVDNTYLLLSDPTELGDVLDATNLNDATVDDDGQTFDFKAIAAQIRKIYLTD